MILLKHTCSKPNSEQRGRTSQRGEPLSFRVGLVTATKGSVQKRILKDGSKDGNHSLSVSKGIYETVALNGLHEFAKAIENIKPNQAFTLGISKLDGRLKLCTNDAYKELINPSRAIARTKSCIQWSTGTFPLLLDHDAEPGKPDLTKDEFWNDTINVIPEMAGTGRLTTTSTSSGIYNRDTGECLRPENGHHTYVLARGDVERFVEIYKARCWLKGAAFFKLANPNQSTGTSSILERFPSDVAVFSPERLVYEAGALLPPTLEQRRSAPQVIEGSVLDLDTIPDLTSEEKLIAEANRLDARSLIEAKQLQAATKAIAATGHKQPRAEAKRRITLCKSGLLEPDHVLEIASGGSLRVEDIGPQHDGLLLKDPQEPDYRNGAQVAKLYWNGDRPWQIHSEAHGGCNYSAATTKCVRSEDTHTLAIGAEKGESLPTAIEQTAEARQTAKVAIAQLRQAAKAKKAELKEQYKLDVAEVRSELERDQKAQNLSKKDYDFSAKLKAKRAELRDLLDEQLKAVRTECNHSVWNERESRDDVVEPLKDQVSAENSAARLHEKLEAEADKWVAIAQEIEPDFTATGNADKDIELARECVFAATTQRVTYDKTVQNTGQAFPDDVLEDLLKGTIPLVIGGVTGGGKTELATQATAYAKAQKPDLKHGAVAPTQVLSVQMAERFESKGVPMESTAIIAEKQNTTPKAKAVPAESLWRFKGLKLEMMSYDEPDQWMPRILSGSLGDAADVNLSTLKGLNQSVDKQFWLNADPNPITIDLIKHLSGQQPLVVNLKRDRPTKPVFVDIYEDDLTETGNILSGASPLYRDFMRDAQRGQKVLLLAGSVSKARALKKQLQKVGVRAQLKDGKYTPKKQRLGFALEPEKVMQSFDVVILTRLVETGLDLQKDFDAVYVCLSPDMQARSAYQFLSRSRSLLRGDTPKLRLYIPSRTFTSVEHLSVSYWAERIRSENKIYLSLLTGDTSSAKQKLEQLDQIIEFSARYKADKARQITFRRKLLLEKFDELGWNIERTIRPSANGERITDELLKEIHQAKRLEAHCTARGYRSIHDYPEAYAAKLADVNEQGLILECKRRKMELSALLPDSDLESVDLIFRLQEDERVLPQTLLLSAIQLNPGSDRIQSLIKFLGNVHLDKINLYGPLQGLKELRKSKFVLTLAVAEIIGNCPLVQRVLAGNDEVHYGMKDVVTFAALLKEHEALINTWCKRYYGREFEWSEDPTSTVCKALDKLLGIQSSSTGQASVKIDGKKKRPRVMRTNLTAEGRKAIAQSKAKKSDTKVSDELAAIESEVQLRIGLCDSAKTGWQSKIENALTAIEQAFESLHTKNKTVEKQDIYFSVQAKFEVEPHIPPRPEQVPLLLAEKAPTLDCLSPNYYDAAAWGWEGKR